MTRPAFAPGVIERHSRQRSTWLKWLRRTAILMALVSTIYTLAFTAGYYWG